MLRVKVKEAKRNVKSIIRSSAAIFTLSKILIISYPYMGKKISILRKIKILTIANKKEESHLKNIAATSSSRGPRRWFQPIVRLRSRPAMNELPKGFAKFIA